MKTNRLLVAKWGPEVNITIMILLPVLLFCRFMLPQGLAGQRMRRPAEAANISPFLVQRPRLLPQAVVTTADMLEELEKGQIHQQLSSSSRDAEQQRAQSPRP